MGSSSSSSEAANDKKDNNKNSLIDVCNRSEIDLHKLEKLLQRSKNILLKEQKQVDKMTTRATALHYASRSTTPEAVLMLLNYKISVVGGGSDIRHQKISPQHGRGGEQKRSEEEQQHPTIFPIGRQTSENNAIIASWPSATTTTHTEQQHQFLSSQQYQQNHPAAVGGKTMMPKEEGAAPNASSFEPVGPPQTSIPMNNAHRLHGSKAADLQDQVPLFDVNAVCVDGRTPLHWATANNIPPAIVEILLKHGANVNASDNDGWTPLHAATIDGYHHRKLTLGPTQTNPTAEIVKVLLIHGANPLLRNRWGGAAKDWVTDETIVQMLHVAEEEWKRVHQVAADGSKEVDQQGGFVMSSDGENGSE